MKKIAIVAIALLAGACTVTGNDGKAVVLTTANAPELIKAQMAKGCPSLMAAAITAQAVAVAIDAAKNTQGVINDVTNMASIACSLLVPPPKTAPVG